MPSLSSSNSRDGDSGDKAEISPVKSSTNSFAFAMAELGLSRVGGDSDRGEEGDDSASSMSTSMAMAMFDMFTLERKEEVHSRVKSDGARDGSAMKDGRYEMGNGTWTTQDVLSYRKAQPATRISIPPAAISTEGR